MQSLRKNFLKGEVHYIFASFYYSRKCNAKFAANFLHQKKGCMWDRQYLKVLRAVSMTKITKVIPEKARNPVERDHLKSSFFAKKLEKNTKTNWE